MVGAGREPDCQSGRPSGCESVRAPAVLEGGPESVVAAAPGADPLTTREHTPDRLDDASDRGPSSRTLRINEVFHSIQGESTHAGRPCYFIRLSGCHLRCTYCDTEYAFREGSARSIDELLDGVRASGCTLVQITGGEPLNQSGVHELIRRLCDDGRTVLIETSGARDTGTIDPRAIVILDVKTPGSGESHRNVESNLERLRPHDEVKFVITDRADYEFAREVIRRHHLVERCRSVLLSPVFEQARGLEIAGCRSLPPAQLATWIIEDGLEVRLQLQMHKFIWDPGTRGV